MTSGLETELPASGLVHVPGVLDETELAELRRDVDDVLREDREQGRGLGSHTYLLHARRESFLRLLVRGPLQGQIDGLLSPNCHLHSYGALRVDPKTEGLAQQTLHRDSPRFTPGLRLGLQVLYLLDASEAETGGFLYAPGSHESGEPPGEGCELVRLDAEAGDALLFDVHLWHRSGVNVGSAPRRALTQTFTLPFLKQQIDLPAASPAVLVEGLDARTLRVLGFDARVPRSLDEFDRPPAERLYKPGQE